MQLGYPKGQSVKNEQSLTGKFISVPGPQYFKAARSYALAAASSSSYAPVKKSFVHKDNSYEGRKLTKNVPHQVTDLPK